MDQLFKEILLLESLLNFQKDACSFRHIHVPSKCYNCTLQSGKQCKGAFSFANHGVKHSDKHVHRTVNCIEQLTVN